MLLALGRAAQGSWIWGGRHLGIGLRGYVSVGPHVPAGLLPGVTSHGLWGRRLTGGAEGLARKCVLAGSLLGPCQLRPLPHIRLPEAPAGSGASCLLHRGPRGRLCVCLSVSACVCTWACLCEPACVCVLVCEHPCVCICGLHVCACLHTCAWLLAPLPWPHILPRVSRSPGPLLGSVLGTSGLFLVSAPSRDGGPRSSRPCTLLPLLGSCRRY